MEMVPEAAVPAPFARIAAIGGRSVTHGKRNRVAEASNQMITMANDSMDEDCTRSFSVGSGLRPGQSAHYLPVAPIRLRHQKPSNSLRPRNSPTNAVPRIEGAIRSGQLPGTAS
jgi:hypothetical protein